MTDRTYQYRATLERLDEDGATFDSPDATLTIDREHWQILGRPGYVRLEVRGEPT